MIYVAPADPALRRMLLPSVIRISDAGLKRTVSDKNRKHPLKPDFDLCRYHKDNKPAVPGFVIRISRKPGT